MTDSERYDLMFDEIYSLKRENKVLQAEITALQDKIERGELVEVVRCGECTMGNIFQKICGRITKHKFRKLTAQSMTIVPTEYHYACKICRYRFWNYGKGGAE